MEFIELKHNRVLVVKKNIKHLYLKIKRSTGQVQVVAPSTMADEDIEKFVREKEAWIITHTVYENNLKLVRKYKIYNGKEISLFGKSVTVAYKYIDRNPQYYSFNEGILNLYIKKDAGQDKVQELVSNWYREELCKNIDKYSKKWLDIMDLEVNEIRTKKMKTRWGTCNTSKKNIWINYELAKLPEKYLEYVIVHEFVHLFEKGHGLKFKEKMSEFFPGWEFIEKDMEKYAIV